MECKPPARTSISLSNLSITKSTEPDTTKMVWIEGGTFEMGSNEFADSRPIHKVSVHGFWMDEHEVTNEQFKKFADATGYITVAERPLNPADFLGVSADKLKPGSAVFTPPNKRVPLNDPLNWWQYKDGASWKHPLGKGSLAKPNEPVVQVSYEDAQAYATWAGKELPTEAEWEYAARAGHNYKNYYWGEELAPQKKWPANIFQGEFPFNNTRADGFDGIAPVKSYKPDAFGLYDMEGNVWEWCKDFYSFEYYEQSPEKDPQGPKQSYDPEQTNAVERVQRGGSFLCSDQYCNRYKAGSRGKGEVSSSSNNLGFRCVKKQRQ